MGADRGLVAVVVVLGVMVWLGRADLPVTFHALAQARGGGLLVGGVLLVLWWVGWVFTAINEWL